MKPTVILKNRLGDLKIFAVDFNETRERWGIVVCSNELGGTHGWENQSFSDRSKAITRLSIIKQEAEASQYWEIVPYDC